MFEPQRVIVPPPLANSPPFAISGGLLALRVHCMGHSHKDPGQRSAIEAPQNGVPCAPVECSRIVPVC